MRRALLGAALTVLSAVAAAQTDAKGARDHPMLARYPDSHIGEYRKSFDAVEFRVRNAIVQVGVDAGRLTVAGFGRSGRWPTAAATKVAPRTGASSW